MSRHHHITPILKSLHWLKILQKIHFKVLLLTHNSLQNSQPTYLCELFTFQPPAQTLIYILLLKKFQLFSIDFGVLNSVVWSEFSHHARFLGKNGMKDFN